jgi:hypothetical protein
MKTIFLRALEADDKAAALRAAIREPALACGRQRFEVDTANFAAVPRSPFAYWVSERLRLLFRGLPAFEAEGRAAKQGLATADDFRFVRSSWAMSPWRVGERWFPFAKGGAFSPFYSDVHLLVKWERSGEEIKSNLNERGGVRSNIWMLRDTATNYFFRPALMWPLRTTSGLSLRTMPAGCIFGHKGPSAFVENDDSNELLAVLALTNSRSFAVCIGLQLAAADAAARSYEVGIIQLTPIPNLRLEDQSTLATLARRAWLVKRSLDTHTETSHAFTLPALLQVEGDTLVARANAWTECVRSIEVELTAIQAEIDALSFDLYGLEEADRRAITQGFGRGTDTPADAAGTDASISRAAANADAEDEDDVEGSTDTMKLAAELVSWAVGVAFGRFDVRLATGAQPLPAEPEPFDPLPVCSLAMLTDDDDLPLTSAPAGYPFAFPENGILVDDPGHPRDLTAAVRAVFDEVFGVKADSWWQEVAALLDPKDHDLRAWLASGFFEHHLKRHSRSRRKAPILWQLGVPSGRYSVWLYAHLLTRDSFFQLQNDVVAPKLAHEERQLTSLVQTAGGSPSAKERKQIAAQEAFVEELRALLDEVKRVAPLWNPTLDDGVVLTMAPLWRLVPQHKPWQKELKTRWDELATGKYDWAHLAMRLWPERAVPKCATDRSLAIAHGLENVFWVEGDDGKWKPRPALMPPVEELVRERTSSAVKAALKSLLERPAAITGGGRARPRRAATTAVAERID